MLGVTVFRMLVIVAGVAVAVAVLAVPDYQQLLLVIMRPPVMVGLA